MGARDSPLQPDSGAVLVEVCNLNNPDDRKLLRSRTYREKIAEALVDALVAFYGGQKSDTGSSKK